MALGGYYTPVSAACGILWSQHKQKWSEIVVERKKLGDTDLAARCKADISCAQVWRHAQTMTELKESMLENINILKKVRDDINTEWQQVQTVQPDSSVRVAVMSDDAPWRKK